MKLGLMTAAFPGLSLEELAIWSADNGYEMIEVACWPSAEGEQRRYAGVCHIDVERTRRRPRSGRARARPASRSRRSRTTRTTSTPTRTIARRRNAHLKKVIDAAAALERPDRRHLRRQRPLEDRPRELQGVPQGLARAPRLRRRARRSRSRSRTARCCSATTNGPAGSTSRARRRRGTRCSRSATCRTSASISTRRTCTGR